MLQKFINRGHKLLVGGSFQTMTKGIRHNNLFGWDSAVEEHLSIVSRKEGISAALNDEHCRD